MVKLMESPELERIKFAILTPTFRRSDTFLPFCVESIRNQVLEADGAAIDYEHYIINDDPNDEAATEYLQALAEEDPRIRPVESGGGYGSCHAFNVGMAAMTNGIYHRRQRGELLPSHVVPVDDDDGLLPGALAAYTRAIKANPRLELIFGKAAFIDADNQPTDDTNGIDYNNVQYSSDLKEFYANMLQVNEIPRTAAIGLLALLRVGYWSTKLTCPDWHIYVKLLHIGVPYQMLDEVTDYYRMHASQISLVRRTDGTWERDGERLRARMPELSLKLQDIGRTIAMPDSSVDYAQAPPPPQSCTMPFGYCGLMKGEPYIGSDGI